MSSRKAASLSGLAVICSMLTPSTPGAPSLRRTAAQAASSTSRPTHQRVETVEAKPLLLFGFLSQLLSQGLEARRQGGFPKAKLLCRLFCRRSFHLNQL